MQPDNYGFFGEFGGAFIPELLDKNNRELKDKYLDILTSSSFQEEYQSLLKNYIGRPSPLYYAKNLSEQYGFNIYLKREDLNHTGSHKINNSIGQALLAKKMGKTRIIAETGAGQHGVATATACALLQLECIVYMGTKDMERQLANVKRMQMLGAKVSAVDSGSKTLKDATNEAIRDWINHPEDTFYILGSVVGNHPYPDLVSRLQSVISLELKEQIEHVDFIVACVGGGSNAIGAFYHYIDSPEVQLIGVEAAGKGIHSGQTAAALAVGRPGVLHGSYSYLMQDKDGQIIEPHSISAGLDYPGIGPQHSELFASRRAKYVHVTDEEALRAAFQLMKLEGIIPALESAHALAFLPKMKLDSDKTVVINLSGRGDKDLDTYLRYQNNLQDVYEQSTK